MATTPRIGEKNASKRHLLVDGRGVPLSLIVTGVNRHDVSQLDEVLNTSQIKQKPLLKSRTWHLCADARYTGRPALQIIGKYQYIPHVKSRHQEAKEKQQHPEKKARRWIVEVSHSWFYRFHKLLVRYEKLHRSFLALNHLAAAIIAFRKIKTSFNIIYG